MIKNNSKDWLKRIKCRLTRHHWLLIKETQDKSDPEKFHYLYKCQVCNTEEVQEVYHL